MRTTVHSLAFACGNQTVRMRPATWYAEKAFLTRGRGPTAWPRHVAVKDVADYVHSVGAKFGIYTSIGKLTCSGYEGSAGHEEADAKLFAEWGVDFLK